MFTAALSGNSEAHDSDQQTEAMQIAAVMEFKLRDWTSPLLLAGGFLFLAASALAALHSVALGLPSLVRWTVGEAATACAGFGTISAVLFALYQFVRQWVHARSKFSLDMAMAGVQRAHAIIGEASPTSRIGWINAARVMSRALKTAANVSEQDHLDAWELFREEWRITFYYVLLRSPEYFFGLPEPPNYEDANAHYDDATVRRLMGQQIAHRATSRSGRSSEGSGFRMLDTASIKVFYDFAKFPSDYADPMDRERFSPQEIDRVERDMFGLSVFLRAARRYYTVGNQVVDRDAEARGVAHE